MLHPLHATCGINRLDSQSQIYPRVLVWLEAISVNVFHPLLTHILVLRSTRKSMQSIRPYTWAANVQQRFVNFTSSFKPSLYFHTVFKTADNTTCSSRHNWTGYVLKKTKEKGEHFASATTAYGDQHTTSVAKHGKSGDSSNSNVGAALLPGSPD
jgi:hypothetical protein